MKKRAYIIWECDEGWCVQRVSAPLISGSHWDDVLAFSRLSQALWWLGRKHPTPDQEG